MPRARMDCRRRHSYWGRRRPWRFTIASTTSMPSSSSSMAPWSTRRACSAARRARRLRISRAVAHQPRRSSKGDDFRLFTGIQIVADDVHGDRPEFGRHGVSDVGDRALAVDEIDNFIGVESALVLHIDEAARPRAQKQNLVQPLLSQTIAQDIVVLK